MENKMILVIGRTGRGKSTLSNVILDKDKKFKEIFKESAGTVSETKKIQVEKLKENNIVYHIIDTPGIGDTNLEDNDVLYTIAEAVYLVKDGVNRVFFVINGRFDQYEMIAYDLLRETIFDKKITDHTTIIRTNFPDFKDEEECEKDIKLMIEQSRERETKLKENIELKKKKVKRFF